MNRKIEEAIYEIQIQNRKFEEIMDLYQTSYLTRFANRVEAALENCRLRSNTEVIYEKVNYIRQILRRTEDLINATIYNNIQDLNKMMSGQPHKLTENLAQIDDMRKQFHKIIESQIDVTEIKYDMTRELKIRDNEEAMYLVGNIITNQLMSLKDEIRFETNRVFDQLMQINEMTIAASVRRKIIIVELNENKKFTIESENGETRLRPWKTEDEFEKDEKYVGSDAREMFENLMLTTSPENKKFLSQFEEKQEKEEIFLMTSDGKCYVIEKLGEQINLREASAGEAFDAKNICTGKEADSLYEQITTTLGMKKEEPKVQNQIQEEKVEKICVITSEGKEFIIEKTNEEMKMRPITPAEEFEQFEVIVRGEEADLLYQELQHTMPGQEPMTVVEDLPSNVIK